MNPINHDQAKAQLDKTLQGNDKIETAIAALQQDATEEMLAHVLTVIRRRTKERAQLIIAVEPPKGDGIINLQAIPAVKVCVSASISVKMPMPM